MPTSHACSELGSNHQRGEAAHSVDANHHLRFICVLPGVEGVELKSASQNRVVVVYVVWSLVAIG